MKIKPIAFEDIGVGAVVLIKSNSIVGAVWMTQVTKVTDTCIHGTSGAWYKETDEFFIVSFEKGYITFCSLNEIRVI